MQHFATAVSCGVEDIRKQPLQHLSAQNDLGVNRNNNCGRRREYGAAASGLCSLMSRVLPLAGPITCSCYSRPSWPRLNRHLSKSRACVIVPRRSPGYSHIHFYPPPLPSTCAYRDERGLSMVTRGTMSMSCSEAINSSSGGVIDVSPLAADALRE